MRRPIDNELMGVVASILGLPISGDRFWSQDIFDAASQPDDGTWPSRVQARCMKNFTGRVISPKI
jgi:hypothetical protein